MNPVKARLISRGGRGSASAQVVVCAGTGAQRQSITRHLQFNPRTNQWLGRNPDEVAIAKLDAAEAAVWRAEAEQERLKKLAAILSPAESRRRKLGEKIAKAAIAIREATAALEGLQRTIPRQVQFILS